MKALNRRRSQLRAEYRKWDNRAVWLTRATFCALLVSITALITMCFVDSPGKMPLIGIAVTATSVAFFLLIGLLIAHEKSTISWDNLRRLTD